MSVSESLDSSPLDVHPPIPPAAPFLFGGGGPQREKDVLYSLQPSTACQGGASELGAWKGGASESMQGPENWGQDALRAKLRATGDREGQSRSGTRLHFIQNTY